MSGSWHRMETSNLTWSLPFAVQHGPPSMRPVAGQPPRASWLLTDATTPTPVDTSLHRGRSPSEPIARNQTETLPLRQCRLPPQPPRPTLGDVALQVPARAPHLSRRPLLPPHDSPASMESWPMCPARPSTQAHTCLQTSLSSQFSKIPRQALSIRLIRSHYHHGVVAGHSTYHQFMLQFIQHSP